MSYPYSKSLDLPPEHSGDNPCFSGVGIDFTKALFCRYVHFAETYLLVTVYKKMNFLNVILLYIHVLQLEASSWIQFQMRQHKHVFIVLKDLVCKGVISKLYFPIMEVHLLEIICKIRGNCYIQWKFSIAKAPYQSGFWGRLISQVKRCLKKPWEEHL